jgi:hypothetical protein
MKYEEEIDGYKVELQKLRKKNDELNICSVLTENYEKIRDQNCDLTLELFDGTTLEVHKAILMGKLIISDPSTLPHSTFH